MTTSAHAHAPSATRHALRRAAAVRHDHREQALMRELWWQVNRVSVPGSGPLRWVLTIGGYPAAWHHADARHAP